MFRLRATVAAGCTLLGSSLSHAQSLHMCYPDSLTPEQWREALTQWRLLPPWVVISGQDFALDSLAWVGPGFVQENGSADRADLTYSFVPDGVTWGSPAQTQRPNDLLLNLRNSFGLNNEDLGLEYMRAGIAVWRSHAALSFREVADDGAAWGQPDPLPVRGILRIGAINVGGLFLGYSSFPSGGGDIAINSSFFTNGNLGSNLLDYRYLRNTVTHEIGHAIGLGHTTPCTQTKMLEPLLVTAFDGLSIDEIRGAHRNYGDILTPNRTAAEAADLGDLSARPVIHRFLSTNGSVNASGGNGSGRDWFRFTLSSPGTVTIRVEPVGGSYRAARQDVNCEPTNPPLINANEASNLALQLRSASGGAVIAVASATTPGPRQIDHALAPGEYTVHVFASFTDPPVNQFVQLYDLTAKADPSAFAFAAPRAIAGISKRVRAGRPAYFLGDINSRAVDPTATLTPASYAWDLDGDGVFEVSGNPRPSRAYISNGVYPVTMRLTDSNGAVATDTIDVVVHGAQTVLGMVTPPAVPRWASTPITLFGVNLRNVTDAAHVTISGELATVEGVPTPNIEGTMVTGLRAVVAPGAPLGVRDVIVSNEDGVGVGVGLLTILPANACPGDTNGDRVIDQRDLMTVLAQYGEVGPGLEGDTNGDQRVDMQDLNNVLAFFETSC